MYKLRIKENRGIQREKVPISFGLIFPRGEVKKIRGWKIETPEGEYLRVQVLPREYYDDGSLKLAEFVFLCQKLKKNEDRIFNCVPPSPTTKTLEENNDIIQQKKGGLEIETGNIYLFINNEGLFEKLNYQGREILCGRSNLISAMTYQGVSTSHAGLTPECWGEGKKENSGKLIENIESVEIVENGPIRSVLEIRGFLKDLSNNTNPVFEYSKRLNFYRGLDEIYFECKLLNNSTPQYLREWKHGFLFKTPEKAVIIGGNNSLEFKKLIDVNLRWNTLQNEKGRNLSGVKLSYSDNLQVAIVSKDFRNYKDGLIQLNSIDRGMETCEVILNRVEPLWHYKGITSHHPINHLLFLEGQRRSFTYYIIFDQDNRCEERVINRENGIQVYLPDLPNNFAKLPISRGKDSIKDAQLGSLKNKILKRALNFVIKEGEYNGLIAGGKCHINELLIEYGVNRAEYAEYLFYEYKRSRDPKLLDIVFQYAERFIDVSIFRSQDHPEWWGAVRHRYSENKPDRVRSMRGPTLLIALYLETGAKKYKDTAFEIAEYILKMFPTYFARQGAVCRELGFLYYFTRDKRFLEKAYEIMEVLKKYQLHSGAWYELFNEQGDPLPINAYIAGEYTHLATAKPEMSSYNIVGLIDAAKYIDIEAYIPMLKKAADWLFEVQDEEGAWRFPDWNSKPQWGHGIFQDVLAMLKAYNFFHQEKYLKAADKAIKWAEGILEENGYIPSVTRQSPHKYLEASLTYFYALEALSIRSEINQDS